jgi:hypothetical protein
MLDMAMDEPVVIPRGDMGDLQHPEVASMLA